MRAASEASLAQAVSRVGTLDLATDGATIAADLFGAADLIAANTALQRALTDPARSSSDKAALVERVFTSLQPGAVQLLTALVGGRWSRSEDLSQAVDILGYEVILRAELAANNLPNVERELFAVTDILAKNSKLRNTLADTHAACAQQRADLVATIFGSALGPASLRLVQRVVAKVEHGRIHSALMRVARKASKLMETQMVVVQTATQPSDAQLQRLESILARKYGSDITLNVTVDPDLVGGMRVHAGADLVEGSLATIMAHTRRVMADAH